MAALRHGPFAQAAAMVTVTAHGLPALRPLAVAGTIALSIVTRYRLTATGM